MEIGGYGRDANGQMIPVEVEIDESMFFQQKYHRGSYRRGQWVFRGIKCDPGKCFMITVGNHPTLEAAIAEYILPGAHIYSDGWAAYHQIDQMNFGVNVMKLLSTRTVL